MTDTTRARLERTFETLKKQHVTPILSLVGSTGARDWSTEHYRKVAEAAGTPTSWVGADVGAEEHGGGYWGNDGELRYRYDDSPVVTLWWWFPNLASAQALVAALAAENLPVHWCGQGIASVELTLVAVPA